MIRLVYFVFEWNYWVPRFNTVNTIFNLLLNKFKITPLFPLKHKQQPSQPITHDLDPIISTGTNNNTYSFTYSLTKVNTCLKNQVSVLSDIFYSQLHFFTDIHTYHNILLQY